MVYKIPLPVGSPSQILDELYIYFSASGESRYSAFTSVFKLQGEGWESKEGISTAHAEAKAAIDNAFGSSKAYESWEGTKQADTNDATGVKRIKADITNYAKECIAAGQSYMYVGLICQYTGSVFGYELSRTMYHPTISFKFKDYEGLETVKQTISYDKQYALAKNGFEKYDQDAIKKDATYLWYELPLPTLTNTQTIVDYKLYLYHVNDVMYTGYGYIAYKDDNGEQRMANSSSYSQLALGDVIADNQAYHVKGSAQYDKIRLTSYAKELSVLGKSKMYVAINETQGSSSTFACDASMSNKVPYVEYIIHDSNGIYSGNEVTELKIVASASDRYNAQNMTNLTVGIA